MGRNKITFPLFHFPQRFGPQNKNVIARALIGVFSLWTSERSGCGFDQIRSEFVPEDCNRRRLAPGPVNPGTSMS